MAENSKIEWTTHTFNPWRFEKGTAKAAIYPVGPDEEPWVPRDDAADRWTEPLPEWSPTAAEVLRIKGVEEVGSCGAQGFHVLVVADSVDELPAAVAHVLEQLERLFSRRMRQAASRQGAGASSAGT